MRIEEAAARRQAQIDSGREIDRRRQQIPADAEESSSTCAKWTTTRCANRSCAGWRRFGATRDAAAVEEALAALTDVRAKRDGQSAGTGGECGARPRHAGRNFVGAGEGLRAVSGGEPDDLRRVLVGKRRRSRIPEGARNGRRIRRSGRPAPAHPGRQDGPGRA